MDSGSDSKLGESARGIHAHLAEFAKGVGVGIGDASHVSVVATQGLIVTAIAARDQADPKTDLVLGLIGLELPSGLSVATHEQQDLPGGTYVLAHRDDVFTLTDPRSGVTIETSAKRGDNGGWNPFPCSSPDGRHIEVHYSACEICFWLVCPGQSIIRLFCLPIPLCDAFSGVFKRLANE